MTTNQALLGFELSPAIRRAVGCNPLPVVCLLELAGLIKITAVLFRRTSRWNRSKADAAHVSEGTRPPIRKLMADWPEPRCTTMYLDAVTLLAHPKEVNRLAAQLTSTSCTIK